MGTIAVGWLSVEVCCGGMECHCTALDVRPLVMLFRPEEASERSASVSSASSGPPVPVAMMTVVLPAEARRQ